MVLPFILFCFVIVFFFVMYQRPKKKEESVTPVTITISNGNSDADVPVQQLHYFCIKDKGYHTTVWPKDQGIQNLDYLEFPIAGMTYRGDLSNYYGEHRGTPPKTVITLAMSPRTSPARFSVVTNSHALVTFILVPTLTPSSPPVTFQMFYLTKCATRYNPSNYRAAPIPSLSPKRITKENGGARALPFVYRGFVRIGKEDWLWWIWGYLGDFSTKFLPNVLPLKLGVKQKGKTGVKHFEANEWCEWVRLICLCYN